MTEVESKVPSPARFPWREAGLTARQAAAHLLDRFAFGPRPGEVDEVAATGLERWLDRQLGARLPEPELARRLRGYRTLDLPGPEIARTYPNPGLVLRRAMAAGAVSRPAGTDPGSAGPEEMDPADRRARRRDLLRYGMEQGYRPQRELLGELLAQKLLRARYAENQLAEVLTDFWFNHFYVSLTDNEVRSYVLAYERDAVRPHVLGDFRDLLGATARHPAMLLYLDNARSTAEEGAPTTLGSRLPGRERLRAGRREGRAADGLNENFARELLELHTLGVEGGYSQADVVAVARAFTGWTVVPPLADGRLLRRVERARRAGAAGFVVEGDFLFRADAHDAGGKRVLGKALAAGRGIEDGEEVLGLLAAHPATAHHLASKLAVRFVADEPPAGLVDRLASTFAATGGDLAATVRALAASPELWAPAARGAKIKSPFELAASALRGLDAEVADPVATLEWIARMGQPLYLYQAPTGYPDRASAWVNTGSLLARMNFGLQLAAGRVEGVRLDLPAIDGGREPESRREALETFLALLLPGRDPGETGALLAALVESPELPRRVADADPGDARAEGAYGGLFDGETSSPAPEMAEGSPLGRLFRRPRERPRSYPEPTPLEQVVGVILGSPEFQRR